MLCVPCPQHNMHDANCLQAVLARTLDEALAAWLGRVAGVVGAFAAKQVGCPINVAAFGRDAVPVCCGVGASNLPGPMIESG